jgi:DNA-directed RNA polymerase alpha subunit
MAIEIGPPNFSGRVRIETPEGPIELDIGSARVFNGIDLLEKARNEQLTRNYQEATCQLERILEQLSPTKNQGSDNLAIWQSKRDAAIERDGPQSVLTLLPREFSHRHITQVANALRRNNIHTKADLASKIPAQLESLRNVGDRVMPLITTIRNVAIAELALLALQAPNKYTSGMY